MRCPARECLDILAAHGYRFSAPRGPLVWRDAGPWMLPLKDIVAQSPSAGAPA
jgi:hypothetical protein